MQRAIAVLRSTIQARAVIKLHNHRNYNHSGKRLPTRSMSMARSGPLYAWHEGVEDLERYCAGGYHPVTLETTFKSGRYKVVHKLGYGSYSTVWLARDTIQNRYVTLKVLVAENPGASSVEASIRARLRSGNPAHPGRTHVQQPLDEFQVEGPNGTHAVLVSEVLGPTVMDLKAASEGEVLPAKVARRLTGQLALGLAYVHKCGIVHGDLHSKNVATTLPSLDDWSVERIYSTFYGDPERDPVMRLDGQPLGPEVPPYTIPFVYFWNLGMDSLTDGAKILDFGEASLQDRPRTSLNTPPPFRAPEAMFNDQIGPPADVWAFGCTVFDLWCQGDHSGMLFGQGFDRSVDGTVQQMVHLLGELPDRWTKQWKMKQAFLEDDGSSKREASLAALVGGLEEINDEDKEGLFMLLQGCLKYEPEERMTAEEISRNEWVRKCLQ
ncbi:kinase-like protein [Agrocybe pediades]|nr:kinase-like protein [Agrocybe pediades]